ncbi:MAG TPA: alpha/beta fold hydrolase [Gemmatimonadaceae bacterium]|nr:alpha/beta fold hydrolase [Gemmatimonadaceae bacterium]
MAIQQRAAKSSRALTQPSIDDRSWPYQARAIDVDGAPVAYYDVGSGPTLLLVHTGLWSFIWRDVIQHLSNHFRCISVDSPGTGHSGIGSWPLSLESAANAVDSVIRALDLRELTLVVHDLGGLSGVVGAGRSRAALHGVVAINTFAWQPNGRFLRLMLRIAGSAAARELDVLTHVVPRITASRFGIGRHLNPSSRRAFRQSMQAPQIRAFHQYLADALRCEPLHHEAERVVSTIVQRGPLLTIFGGRNDPFGFQAEWKRRVPHASELVLAGGNHFPMCDDPSLVAGAIREWHHANNGRGTP